MNVMHARMIAVCLALWGAVAAPAQTGETPEKLKATAEYYVKQGQKREGAESYEQLIKVDPSTRLVVAPLLVKLYVETKQPRQALSWAQQVMTNMPDPKAYLAGVYESIGSRNEARALLEHELSANNDRGRILQLRLQLASLEEHGGRMDEARAQFQLAADVAKGSPDEALVRRMLQRISKPDVPDLPAGGP